MEKKSIHAFPKSISTKWNTDNFSQDLNLGCCFHFLWWLPLCWYSCYVDTAVEWYYSNIDHFKAGIEVVAVVIIIIIINDIDIEHNFKQFPNFCLHPQNPYFINSLQHIKSKSAKIINHTYFSFKPSRLPTVTYLIEEGF